MRLRTLAALAAVALTAACADSPTGPSATSSAQAVAAKAADAAPQTATGQTWPVQHPDGAYGHEDPAYPPTSCKSGFRPVYNNHNFVCEDGAGNREMPR